MGFRALVPDAVERPALDNLVGSDPDAARNPAARIRRLCGRQAPWGRLGRPALPGSLRVDAPVPGVWATGDHRYAHYPVLGSDRLVAGRYVAFTDSGKHSQVCIGVCRCLAVEVFFRAPAVGVSRGDLKLAPAPCARAASLQARAQT